MTDYFEAHVRDGAARTGELRLSDSVTTSAVVDDVFVDIRSLWAAERKLSDGSGDVLTVLPHRSLPAGSANEVREPFSVAYPDVDLPSAAVVIADTTDDFSADAYALSDTQSFVGHARAFRDNVTEAKENLPADTALALSDATMPRNVPPLVYAGVDLVDEKLTRTRGLEGFYPTSDGEYFPEDLDELSCACEACHKPTSEFTRADTAGHNANALCAGLARVRRRAHDGRLRDYVKEQARHNQWLTALFHRFNQQYSFTEQWVPAIRDSELTATSEESIDHVEIQRFVDHVTKRYCNRFDNSLVLLPCSAEKPYSKSRSHRQLQETVQCRVHVMSMTSPIGVVLQELELIYPAQRYDSVVMGDWSEDEKPFVAGMFRCYLGRDDYPRITTRLPPDAHTDIVERVADDSGLDVELTVSKRSTATEFIGNLIRVLDGEPKLTREEREHSVMKVLADHQLGPSMGDMLFSDIALEMTSRYLKLQVRSDADVQLTMMVPRYGVLSFTLEDAKMWRDSDVSTKTVEIDDFVPHDSVLAPDIVDVDEDIHPGDEVVAEGPKAFAIDRAEMGDYELVESTRGIGVEIHHVEERQPGPGLGERSLTRPNATRPDPKPSDTPR